MMTVKSVVNELIERMKKSKIITLIDYGSYCPELSCNGGKYYYETEFLKDDEYYIACYYTSADFSFCPKLGEFQDCFNCMFYDYENNECIKEDETVNFEEILNILINFLNSGDNFDLYLNERIAIESEGHECGYCSLCDYEYGNSIEYIDNNKNRVKIDRDKMISELRKYLKSGTYSPIFK